MTNDTDMAADLVSGFHKAHKGPARRDTGAGVEVRVRAARRRGWPAEDNLRIVPETLEAGAVAQAVADRHGISTGLPFTSRKETRSRGPGGWSIPGLAAAPD